MKLRKRTITLGREDTRRWENSGPVGDAFRREVRAFARQAANRLGKSVEIYASKSDGGWVAAIVEPQGHAGGRVPLAPALYQIGDAFDYFGETWTIAKIRQTRARRDLERGAGPSYEYVMHRADRDAFGKLGVGSDKTIHERELRSGTTFRKVAGYANGRVPLVYTPPAQPPHEPRKRVPLVYEPPAPPAPPKRVPLVYVPPGRASGSGPLPPMWKVGDAVTYRGATMRGVVTHVGPSLRIMMSDGRSWHRVRVRWENGYENPLGLPEAGLAHAEGSAPGRASGKREKMVATYTTAPEAYDYTGFGAVDLGVVGHTDRGKPIRKVMNPEAGVDHQRGRYASGMHMSADEVEWKKLVSYKLVTKVSKG